MANVQRATFKQIESAQNLTTESQRVQRRIYIYGLNSTRHISLIRFNSNPL